tara:strand:- start:776 stop:1141 length:366 start_codon:yes stop_codon:yes gene_type:complete
MDLKITGIVKELLPEQSGTSAKGLWRKREFILTTEGKYPKQICMVQWGDSIDKVEIGVGEKVTASIDIASREHNGRWYTDVKAWKIEQEAAAPVATERKMPAPMGVAELAKIGDPDDDLPF